MENVLLTTHENSARGVACSPDGNFVFSVGYDNCIRKTPFQQQHTGMEDEESDLTSDTTTSDSVLASIDMKITKPPLHLSSRLQEDAHVHYVTKICCAQNGKFIVTADCNGDVLKVWDGETLRLRQELQSHKNDIFCVTISPDCKHIASGDEWGDVKIWEEGWAIGWDCRQTWKDHECHACAVAYSDNSKLLATGSWDGTVMLYRIYEKDYHLFGKLQGHSDHINDVSFSVDRATLMSCGNDRSIIVWSIAELQIMKRIDNAHSSFISRVVHSADGLLTASCGQDQGKQTKATIAIMRAEPSGAFVEVAVFLVSPCRSLTLN